MKKIKLVIFLLGIVFKFTNVNAQVSYNYDNRGNRIDRIYVGPPSGERTFAPNAPNKDIQKPDLRSKQLAMDFGISVFPTQVNEILSLTILSANENAPAIVSIFDNLGKEVYNIKVQNSSQQQINFTSIKNGMYNLSIKIKNQQVFYKVVKGN